MAFLLLVKCNMFQTIRIYLGEKLDYKEFRKSLIYLGYNNVSSVQERGEFSAKGANIVIYPSSYDLPLRIEFLDEVVDSIKVFNPLTGDVLEEHRMLVILPARLSSLKDKQSLFLETSPLSNFLDLEKGDYVVHVEHGIGKFLGLKKLEGQDYFLVEYKDKDRLYVPLKDTHLIQKYIGFRGRAPKLSKIGTKEWQRIKKQARRGIENFARELLQIQAKRAVQNGYSFPKDTEWQKRLEEDFPYKETVDQTKAIQDVKKDMESSYPMDRLICGDVGYGKTEVALRAAFKAVLGNKQVALLVPTTILAEQHYERFKSRLEQFPVRVEMLSRFKSQKDQKEIVADLAKGKVDIIIGTHRLFSEDIKFKDLGLLIIDEEQRFGVFQKEQFKKLREIVDVLTLTATPIPRTLYISLLGMKDVSIINMAPENRIPIETSVSEYNDNLVKRAIKRELSRNGQVFFVHNRIKGIKRIADKIESFFPQVRIAIAHGRMPEKELEKIMVDFLDAKIDILVSTSIIQSGIDIPNVNTIIINRADRFGLADLYQLRGRVGRYNRKAYAYFLIPKAKPISQDALRRLKSIAKHSELGAGFKVAMEDLEIRGAGNILGTEQHGFIQAVGFDLYCRLLRETIYELTNSALKQKILNEVMFSSFAKDKDRQVGVKE